MKKITQFCILAVICCLLVSCTNDKADSVPTEAQIDKVVQTEATEEAAKPIGIETETTEAAVSEPEETEETTGETIAPETKADAVPNTEHTAPPAVEEDTNVEESTNGEDNENDLGIF